MKPLYELNKSDKETYLHLLIYGMMDRIREKADKWFEKKFKGSIKYPEELLIDNLKDDLDYIFSEAIWVIELGESQGFDMSKVKSFLQSDYDKYTGSEHGYRFLVENPYYNAYENKLLTEEEVVERDKKMDEGISALIQDMMEKGEFN